MKNCKSFIAGMLTMLLICVMVGSAGATNGKVMQELEYRDIKISLDGKVLDLRDAQGNVVEPFKFNGTNYVPVRALAENLGLNVAWDGANATVVLTSTQDSGAGDEAVSETLLFARGHVRVYFLNLTSSNGSASVNLRVENDSDYEIKLGVRDEAVNGKNAYGKISCQVAPGKSATTALTFAKEELEKIGQTEVKRVDARFTVNDVKNYSNGYETGNYTFR